MNLKFLLPLIFSSLLLGACQQVTEVTRTSSTTYGGNANTTTDMTQYTVSENRALVLEYCQMDELACGCFADKLNQTLSAEQWKLLRAALTRIDTPNLDTSEAKLTALNNQVSQALQSCSK